MCDYSLDNNCLRQLLRCSLFLLASPEPPALGFFASLCLVRRLQVLSLPLSLCQGLRLAFLPLPPCCHPPLSLTGVAWCLFSF